MTRIGEDSETILKIMEREQAVREERGCYLREKVAWERRKGLRKTNGGAGRQREKRRRRMS